MRQDLITKLNQETQDIFARPNMLRSVIVLLISSIIAYWLSHFVAKAIIKVGQIIAVRSDNAVTSERTLQLRRVETYLSITVAIVRSIIVALVAYISWRSLSDAQSAPAAAIGLSAFIVVAAGATFGTILRDVTAGVVMIIEHWFHVGDYVRIEPYGDVTGVVERVTLRSTKLRSLSGEVIWLHNQYIQGVKITPRGLRRIAVDIFVNNEKVAKSLIEKAVATIPTGTMKVAKRPEIVLTEKWGEHLWLLTVVGETPPGREWLLENYFVDSLKDLDERRRGPQTLIRPPIVRYSDKAAERSFKRAVRVDS